MMSPQLMHTGRSAGCQGRDRVGEGVSAEQRERKQKRRHPAQSGLQRNNGDRVTSADQN